MPVKIKKEAPKLVPLRFKLSQETAQLIVEITALAKLHKNTFDYDINVEIDPAIRRSLQADLDKMKFHIERLTLEKVTPPPVPITEAPPTDY